MLLRCCCCCCCTTARHPCCAQAAGGLVRCRHHCRCHCYCCVDAGAEGEGGSRGRGDAERMRRLLLLLFVARRHRCHCLHVQFGHLGAYKRRRGGRVSCVCSPLHLIPCPACHLPSLRLVWLLAGSVFHARAGPVLQCACLVLLPVVLSAWSRLQGGGGGLGRCRLALSSPPMLDAADTHSGGPSTLTPCLLAGFLCHCCRCRWRRLCWPGPLRRRLGAQPRHAWLFEEGGQGLQLRGGRWRRRGRRACRGLHPLAQPGHCRLLGGRRRHRAGRFQRGSRLVLARLPRLDHRLGLLPRCLCRRRLVVVGLLLLLLQGQRWGLGCA